MITMSNDFKNSISKTEREMKGYVEVIYTSAGDKDNASLNNGPYPLVINGHDIDTSGILDNERRGKNYASLEQDYFKLDGSFVLPNNQWDKNPGMPFTTKDLAEDVIEPISIITGWQTTQTNCNGITIYFQNNIPLDMEIGVSTIRNGAIVTDTYTMNDITISSNGVASVTFENQYVSGILITINEMLYPKKRIRIQEVDFGLSSIYEGEDLISFKTIEQCNRFYEETPINECEVILGDYQDNFNSINPKGITKYLTQNVIIKPYVGVLTEDTGVEYCPQGWYWLDEWKKNQDNVTLNCKGYLNKLQRNAYLIQIKQVENYYNDFENIDLGIWYNSNVSPANNNAPVSQRDYYKLTTGLEAFQKYYSYFGNAIVEAKNQNDEQFTTKHDYNLKALYYGKDGTIKRRIGKEILQKYQEITLKPELKNITVKEYQYPSYEQSDNVLYENVIDCNGEETLVYDYGKLYHTLIQIICDDYSQLEIIDARGPIYDKDWNYIYETDYGIWLLTYAYVKIRYNGTITLKITANMDYKEEVYDNVINYSADGENLEYNNEIICGQNSRECSNFWARFRKENDNKYKTRFTFNGDPSLELGDNIEVESKFKQNGNTKYDLVWITKIESEYNGSFNQSIEGDIIE